MNIKDAFIGQKVESGRPYSDDYDQGKIDALYADGTAEVAWQSGVNTSATVRSLREGWSERWAEDDDDADD